MKKETLIQDTMTELLKKLNVKADVSVDKQEDRFLVQLATEVDAPSLIGRYGETLISLQRILEAMIYKVDQTDVSILVNVNDYREKQKERLEGIADNIAKRVMETKRPSFLRSFSSYERKMIHEYISTNYPDLESHSEDEGTARKLVITLRNEENTGIISVDDITL